MIIETGYGSETYNTHTGRLSSEEPPTSEQGNPTTNGMSVTVTVTRSSGWDGAVLVMIDTEGFEPDGSDGGPGLRVLVNDANVAKCDPRDFVTYGYDEQERPARSAVLTAELADLTYEESDVSVNGVVVAKVTHKNLTD